MSVNTGQEIVPAPNSQTPMHRPSYMTIAEITERIAVVQTVMKEIMIGPVMSEDGQKVVKHGVHYDIIPGCQKPSLLQPGAEILLLAFGLGARHEVTDISADGEVHYRVRCIIYNPQTGLDLGDEWGECSSLEDKYAWGKAGTDKEFEETPIDRKRVIWKKGGWKNGQKQEDYQVLQVRANPSDVRNTILAMACKRAKVRATRAALACSSIFDVNLEDIPESMREQIAGEQTHTATPEQRERAQERSQHRNASNAARRTGATQPGTLTPAQEAAGQTVVTFGQHKGKKLIDIPRDYIGYLYDKANSPAMKEAAGIFLGKIASDPAEPAPGSTTTPPTDPAYPTDPPPVEDPDNSVDPFADQ